MTSRLLRLYRRSRTSDIHVPDDGTICVDAVSLRKLVMDWPVSETKVIPPKTHRAVVPRQRLLSLLDESTDYQLYLVIAPAGYGKTTLLADWVHRRSTTICWYSLTEMDENSHRFYSHFIAALAAVFPSFGRASQTMLEGLIHGQSSVEQLVITLVNELAGFIREDFTFILDDYHLVDQEEEINTFVSQFIQYVPSTCHVILSSRTLIGLPDLDLLVARGEVSGLDYEELAFQSGEVQRLAKQHAHRRLSREQAEMLTKTSEGWITGILLSTQTRQWQSTHQLRALKASGVDLFSYFAQQVLEKQPSNIRDFLLRTSFLDEFDAETCTAVFDKDAWLQDDLHQAIDHIRRSNLFVAAVGSNGELLRYHKLFQDFAQHKFIKEEPQEALGVVKRLCDSYASTQQWEHAFQLFRRLDDAPTQVDFLCKHGQSMLRAFQMQLLTRWINKLPHGLQFNHPELMALFGSATVASGASDFGVSILNQAKDLINFDHAPVQLVLVHANLSAGLRLLGRYADALANAEMALELAQEVESNRRDPVLADGIALCKRLKGLVLYMMGDPGHMSWLRDALSDYQSLQNAQDIAVVSMEIGVAYLSRGNLRQAQPFYESAATGWRALHNLAGQANVLNNLGYLHYLRSDYGLSTDAYLEALHAAQQIGYQRIEAYILSGIADLMMAIGLETTSAIIYKRAKELAEIVNESFLILYIELAEMRLAWENHDEVAAYRNISRAGELVQNRDSEYEWHLYHMTMGRFYIAQEKSEQALKPLQEAARHFSEIDRSVDLVVTQLFLAIARSSTETAEARRTLEEAIRTALASDYAAYFTMIGAKEMDGLEKLIHESKESPLVRGFAQQCQETAASMAIERHNLQDRLYNALSITEQNQRQLSIQALGKPQVWKVGERISSQDWTVATARDLFFCLLAHPHGLTKEEVGALFWPDCTVKQLQTRFKNTLYRLRKAVGRDAILYNNNTYYFNHELDYELDVKSFLQKSQEAESATDVTQRVEALASAVELYNGPYLAGMDALWAIPERERLHQIFLDTGLKLASLCLELDEAREALAYCQRVLQEDSCLEEAHRLAMRIYYAMGNRGEITNQYEECRTVLRDEIGAEPSTLTTDLLSELME